MSAPSTTIKTILRIKPGGEIDRKQAPALKINRNNTVIVEKNTKEEVFYSFDSCHGCSSTQDDIFEEVELYLDNITRGINTTIMAYGATGSGKTYTMCGTEKNPGVIPKVALSLFGKYAATLSVLFKVKVSVSYLEVYNEKVYDLLSASSFPAPLPVREDAMGKVVVQGVVQEAAQSVEKFKEIFERGVKRRKSAKTLLNSESSRSHAVLSVFVTLATETSEICSKIHLVDLAGSESNKRAGNEGERMAESANINRSLFVLNKVVDSLAKGYSRIPYRDSKLTRLLQDSLGGTSDCVLIVNVAGDVSQETLSTLAFSGRSKEIRLKTQEEKMRENPWKAVGKSPLKNREAHSKKGKQKEPEKEAAAGVRRDAKSAQRPSRAERAELRPVQRSANPGTRYVVQRSRSARKERGIQREGRDGAEITKENREERPEPAEKKSQKRKTKKQNKTSPLDPRDIVDILNSGDFLRIKSLPMIGDRRAQKILVYSKATYIENIEKLLEMGIPKKIVLGIISQCTESAGSD